MAVSGQSSKVAPNTGKQRFNHLHITRAHCEIGYMDTISLVRNAIPCANDIAIIGARPLLITDPGKGKDKIQRGAALFDGQKPGETHPWASEIAESRNRSLETTSLLEVDGERSIREDGVVTRGAYVEVWAIVKSVPIIILISWFASRARWEWPVKGCRLTFSPSIEVGLRPDAIGSDPCRAWHLVRDGIMATADRRLEGRWLFTRRSRDGRNIASRRIRVVLSRVEMR